MTIHGTFTVTIDAPPETVWPWIGDLDRHAAWSPKPYQVALVSGEANTVGSRYRSIGRIPGDRRHENVVEITDVVPHERLILRATDAMGHSGTASSCALPARAPRWCSSWRSRPCVERQP